MPRRWLSVSIVLCLTAISNDACARPDGEVFGKQTGRNKRHSALRHQLQHDQGSSGNFRNLTEDVQTHQFEDLDLSGDYWATRASIRSQQESFHPYIALRSPVVSAVQRIKVFVQAESYMMEKLECGFSMSGHSPARPDIILKPNAKQFIGLEPRRYSDYMMTCPDPGAEYATFSFVHGKIALKSIPIQTTETSQGGAGVCVGRLYSNVRDFGRWVVDTLEAGFSDIYVFYTHIDASSQNETNSFYGLMPAPPGETQGGFQPYWHDRVHYYYYDYPSHSFNLGQLLLYNMCVQQNNPKHDFIGIFDPDEYFWKPKSSESLASFLHGLIGDKAASIDFDRVHFPAACQAEPFLGAQSKLHWPKPHQDKSVVMPARSQIVGVHQLVVPEGNFEKAVQAPITSAYFKHVRHEDADCARDELVDTEILSTSAH